MSALPLLALVLARQALNFISNICLFKDVESACLEYVGSEDSKITGLRWEQWMDPKWMPPTQSLPLHILHFLSSYQVDYSV